MTESDATAVLIAAARPRALAALVRYFRDLDVAEEAVQNACLKALRHWRDHGPPRDPIAWLVLVGRNGGIDARRRQSREQELPDEARISDVDDAETPLVERLDDRHYQDDLLRLLFVCCHPTLEPAQQIALALRIVSGLSVREIARAFLVTESAIEQRLTRAKRRVAAAGVPFETPSAIERSQRLGAVQSTLLLLYNEGYAATSGAAHIRSVLADEAIRLTRLLLKLFPAEPETMGLLALFLLQHARTPARLDGAGQIILLEAQDRRLWNAGMIAEGLALLDKAMRHRAPGPFQVQAAIAALHDRAGSAAETDWAGIAQLYTTLEALQPTPVVRLNRAVAVAKIAGPAAALALVEPLAEHLGAYFYFHGLRGALLKQLGRPDEARVAWSRAIALATSVAEAQHIRMELDHLMASERNLPGPVGPDVVSTSLGEQPTETPCS